MDKKVGVNLEENRLEHSGSEVLEGDGAQERKTAESGRELTGEEQNLKRLEEENERLRQEIERVRNLPLKERLYDKVHVSVRTLDIFIAVMIILGIIAVSYTHLDVYKRQLMPWNGAVIRGRSKLSE